MKVQITLDDKLVERLDEYADNNYMSRSGLISFATTQFLNQADCLMYLIVNRSCLTMPRVQCKDYQCVLSNTCYVSRCNGQGNFCEYVNICRLCKSRETCKKSIFERIGENENEN